MLRYFLFITIVYCTLISCGQNSSKSQRGFNFNLSDKQWKDKLSTEQYQVLRKRGTETAFTGEYWNNKKTGVYKCAGCNQNLFSSQTKFKSGTGWPSFYNFITNTIELGIDNNLTFSKNEVHCANCGGHLGHVFEDGPKPTGMRYCINSIALNFEEK